MQLRYAIFCDYSSESIEGKLNLLGITEAIYAYSFPAVHREGHLICAFELEPGDSEKVRKVAVQLVDADGNRLLEINTEVQAPPQRHLLNHRHLLHDIQFPKEGTYEFAVLVDGFRVGGLPLQAIRLDPPNRV
jgi:hypothetical protein